MIGIKQVNIIVAQFLGLVAFEHGDHPGGTLVGHFKGLLEKGKKLREDRDLS